MVFIDNSRIRLLDRVRQRADGDERAASLIEYALLLALIAVVCVTAVTVPPT